MIDVILNFGFKHSEDNMFIRGFWTVRIFEDTFECYCDPEIDDRYYYGFENELNDVLSDI